MAGSNGGGIKTKTIRGRRLKFCGMVHRSQTVSLKDIFMAGLKELSSDLVV